MRGNDLRRRLVRHAQGRAIPTADPRRFDRAVRRTRVVRLTLAAALVAAIVGAFVVAPTRAGRRFIPADAVGIVVLDVSSSVKPKTYDRIEQTLATIAASRTRLGLVLFSDTAYEALPPGTPSEELVPLLRFFAPATPGAVAPPDEGARSPWEQWFSAGTRISSGLYLAAHMLKKEHVARGAVILVSDLADDPTDILRVTDAVRYLDQQQMPLEIVALDPTPANADFWRTLLGDEAIFREAHLPTQAQAEGKVELNGTFSKGLLALSGVVLVLLTVNVWWAEPLRWRGRTA